MGRRPTRTIRGNQGGVTAGDSFVSSEPTTPTPAWSSMRPPPGPPLNVTRSRRYHQPPKQAGSNNNNNNNTTLLSAALAEPPASMASMPSMPPPLPSIRPLLNINNNNNGRSPATTECGDGENSVIFDFGSNYLDGVDWKSVESDILSTSVIHKVEDQLSSVEETIQEFTKENLL